MRLIVPAAASLAVFMSCLPTEGCGCSPPSAQAVLVATVRDAAGGPVAGAIVTVQGAYPYNPVACSGADYLEELGSESTPTGGILARLIYSSSPVDRCLRITAQTAPKSGVAVRVDTVAGVTAVFKDPRIPPDTVRVDLVVR